MTVHSRNPSELDPRGPRDKELTSRHFCTAFQLASSLQIQLKLKVTFRVSESALSLYRRGCTERDGMCGKTAEPWAAERAASEVSPSLQ